MPRGFIIQPTYRIERGRPVVLLYGVLESGGSFLLRDDRQVPHFYIRERDAGRAGGLGAQVQVEEPPRTTIDGARVARVEVPTPPDAPGVRDRLLDAGIACFEADVRFAYRYLIDRGIRGSLEIIGEPHGGGGGDAVFENPDIRPADWIPDLSILSFDIETDPRGRLLLSISLAGCGADEVLLLTPPGSSCPEGAVPFATEADLLRAFAERVRELDPDVLTGWNVIGFDLSVLLRLSEQHGVPLVLGRGTERLRLRRLSGPRPTTQAQIPGRLVLDGIDLLRGAFIRMESYSLNAVSREVLGQEKIITGPDRAHEIHRAFHDDRARFVEYNLKDAQLVLEILDKLHLVSLAVERSRLTGLPPDRVAASIAAFDFLYLSQLSRRRLVAPTVDAENAPRNLTGGHVLEPESGLHGNVMVFDFKSLYPSIIRTFQIDPVGHVPVPGPGDDLIRAPNGACFRKAPGILPGLLDDLFPRREEAKAAGDKVASQAIKILMNSFYGVLGASGCRFASAALANAITGFGREILIWTRRQMEERGYTVLYGDTDSLFVASGQKEEAAAGRLGARLAAELNDELSRHIGKTWGVTSKLELEFENLYLRFFLPALRHGTAGARKRYVGLVRDGDATRVIFTGMEAVRRDWTDLARRVQRELYERLFADRPVDSYLRQVVADLRAGQYDDLLVYRKALRKKSLAAYTASTPPHVAAARKMSRKPGRMISYVITADGPEPAAERRSPIDHEHYVQKQVRGVAEPVLALLDLEFEWIAADERQMKLF